MTTIVSDIPITQGYFDKCKALHDSKQLRVWRVGDYYTEEIGEWYVSTFIGDAYYSCSTNDLPFKDWVWLPRQRDLQDMIYMPLTSKLKLFYEYIARYEEDILNKMSMEELWLEFLMSRCNYTWNKETKLFGKNNNDNHETRN